MKRLVRKVVGRWGYELVPNGQVTHLTNEIADETYRAVLRAIHAVKGRLSVVVIGANDGRIDDPAYPLVAGPMRQTSRVILFEPQTRLIPFLKQNYADHPDCHVVNAAVGTEGHLDLHAIRPEAWARMQPDYARTWPEYRAPTGVTSSDRDHVLRFARRFLDPQEAEDALETYRVPTLPLAQALTANGIPSEVDVVQVDTEGFDDQVIYNSDVETLRPAAIFFENDNLSMERQGRLAAFLDGLGYFSIPMRLNTLCIRREGA